MTAKFQRKIPSSYQIQPTIPKHPSEQDKKEFFLVMISELQALALQSEYHTLGQILNAALLELQVGQPRFKAKVQLAS
jgi:hypothetical protein